MSTAGAATTADDGLMDAARACIEAVGWRRTTLTAVAQRAGVSRMTIYRRWPDMQTLLADVLTREWQMVEEQATAGAGEFEPGSSSLAATVARHSIEFVRALRENTLWRRIVELDPELLLPYLLDRRGRSQQHSLDLFERVLAAGADNGVIVVADPARTARAIALASQGFLLSAATMTGDGVQLADLEHELAAMIESHLTP